MSDHMLSQDEIDALVKGGNTQTSESKPPISKKDMPNGVHELFQSLEYKLGDALSLFTGARAVTVCSNVYVKEAKSLGDPRYVISLGSTKENIDILIYVSEDATSSIIKQISDEPDGEDIFTGNNMDVFGKVIEAIEVEFSKEISLLTNRHFNLALALPKGPSSLQEFLDPLKDYLALEYKLEWDETEVGVLGFILENDDAQNIFDRITEDETTPSIDSLLSEGLSDQDMDIFSQFTDFNEPDEVNEEVVVKPVQFGQLKTPKVKPQGSDTNLDIILDLPVSLTVELGRTSKTLEEILNLKPGSVVELDRLAGEPVDILANGVFVAKGEVVVIDETFGVKITEIASKKQRLSRIK